jgi:hypothetical protein
MGSLQCKVVIFDNFVRVLHLERAMSRSNEVAKSEGVQLQTEGVTDAFSSPSSNGHMFRPCLMPGLQRT